MWSRNSFRAASIILTLISSLKAQQKTTESYINNCAEVIESGVYSLRVPDTDEFFDVYCDQETRDGGWTLVLRRDQGKVYFHDRYMEEFKNGFGDFEHEYFMGLEKLHLLSTTRTHSMLIWMIDFDDVEYATSLVEFEISSERECYAFSDIKSFTGTEIGLFIYGNTFCAVDIPRCYSQLPGWSWSGTHSLKTKNVLNLFGEYPKVGDNIGARTMGLFNIETNQTLPLRAITILIRPVNIFKSSYGDTYAKLY